MAGQLPKSQLNLTTLIPRLEKKGPNPSPQISQIKSKASQPNRNVTTQDLLPISSGMDFLNRRLSDVESVLRETVPGLDSLSIDSADIANLYVGSDVGPGNFIVFSGPPDFAQIGWIGSQDSGDHITVTSIVGGLVTTAIDHELKVNSIVLIDETTNPDHNGYFVVDTVPTSTTFTAINLTGNSTGGTATRQFQGAWLHTVAIGGTSFPTAVIVSDDDGSVLIKDAKIIFTSNDLITTLNNDVSPFGIGTVGIDAFDVATEQENMVTGLGFFIYDTPSDTLTIQITSAGGAGQITVRDWITPTSVAAIQGNGSFIAQGPSSLSVMTPTSVQSPAYYVGVSPGISLVQDVGESLTVTMGSAITSVDFTGETTTSGSFVTSVVLNTVSLDFDHGILT